jgi:uncharacterized repeat protein (TIGR04076 family)
MNDLRIEVVKVKAYCGAKHRAGVFLYVRGSGTIEVRKDKKVCICALNSLFPFLTTKQRVDELPVDDWVAETEILACPDPKGVIF